MVQVNDLSEIMCGGMFNGRGIFRENEASGDAMGVIKDEYYIRI
jgi:hypothetical protein